MIKVAITGSTGLVGTRIVELLQDKFTFIHILQEEVDLTNRQGLWKHLKELDFDIVLHLAAYTNVDQAEKQRELAYAINVEGTRNIFEYVNELNKKIIYVSTDFVFDGKQPPYYEDGTPNPEGYYGQTKLEGEKIIDSRGMIIRIAYPYRNYYELKPDFVRKIKNLLIEKKTLNMITDSLITPTFVDDIAYSLDYLFQNYSPEIFHIVGADSLSPYEAGKFIANNFNLDQSLILPTTFEEYSKNKALRTQYSEIKSKKNHFYKMKTFEEGIKMID